VAIERDNKNPFYLARKALGEQVTQAEVARRAGTSQPIVSDLESGKLTNPSYQTMGRIAAVLHKKPEELLPILPPPVPPERRAHKDRRAIGRRRGNRLREIDRRRTGRRD
jgi:transcriptional regulator with XRE-family HTH domain